MYLRCAIAALSLLAGLASADNANSAYSAPASTYGAPAPSYSAPAPSYGAPAPSYAAAPDAGYGAPSGYDAPAYDYAAPAPSGFDPSSLISLIIPALIVIGLIILAVIVGGFLLSLLGGALGLGALAPFINAILNIFGLTLCTVGPPVAIFTGTAIGRTFGEVASEYGYNLSEDQMNMFGELAETAINTIKSHYF
jgi:hypothetical protein